MTSITKAISVSIVALLTGLTSAANAAENGSTIYVVDAYHIAGVLELDMLLEDSPITVVIDRNERDVEVFASAEAAIQTGPELAHAVGFAADTVGVANDYDKEENPYSYGGDEYDFGALSDELDQAVNNIGDRLHEQDLYGDAVDEIRGYLAFADSLDKLAQDQDLPTGADIPEIPDQSNENGEDDPDCWDGDDCDEVDEGDELAIPPKEDEPPMAIMPVGGHVPNATSWPNEADQGGSTSPTGGPQMGGGSLSIMMPAS